LETAAVVTVDAILIPPLLEYTPLVISSLGTHDHEPKSAR